MLMTGVLDVRRPPHAEMIGFSRAGAGPPGPGPGARGKAGRATRTSASRFLSGLLLLLSFHFRTSCSRETTWRPPPQKWSLCPRWFLTL